MNIDISKLQDGVTVLCVGFFVVFAFLTVLIFAMNIMSAVVRYLNKIFPVASPSLVAVKKSAGGEEEIAVAIAAAILKMNK